MCILQVCSNVTFEQFDALKMEVHCSVMSQKVKVRARHLCEI
jgi:hypothetical protein